MQIGAVWDRFWQDERGASLVEFAAVVALFLVLIFGLLDFGRAFWQYGQASTAAQIAARIAIVRPPVCAGVPDQHVLAAGAPRTDFGTACLNGGAGGICANPGVITCTGGNDATTNEIWNRTAILMPAGTTQANYQFSYEYTDELGFLGGPFVPMVTVEIVGAQFQFITPIGGLLQLVGGAGQGFNVLNMPTMRTTLPGEDLAEGNNG